MSLLAQQPVFGVSAAQSLAPIVELGLIDLAPSKPFAKNIEWRLLTRRPRTRIDRWREPANDKNDGNDRNDQERGHHHGPNQPTMPTAFPAMHGFVPVPLIGEDARANCHSSCGGCENCGNHTNPLMGHFFFSRMPVNDAEIVRQPNWASVDMNQVNGQETEITFSLSTFHK